MSHKPKTAVIIGNSISGCMMACKLKQENPALNVILLGNQSSTPIVGESMTEYSTLFFRSIGLSNYLEENHHHKYGLTFYFKENLTENKHAPYACHKAPAIPLLPSKQINRFEIDNKLLELAQEKGCQLIEAWVKDMIINPKGSHQIIFEDKNKTTKDILYADYLIDCSGRSRLLSKKLNLLQKAPFQRSSFWIRLKNFDRTLIIPKENHKNPQEAYDSYYGTHHFMGKGNWVWCIPLKNQQKEEFISIGIVYTHRN